MNSTADPALIPENATYDVINGLFDQAEGVVYRRGGGTYKGSATAASMVSVYDVNLAVGQRTVMMAADRIMQLGADDATPQDILATGSFSGVGPRRAVVKGGALVIPINTSTFVGTAIFGGSRKTANYNTGTISITDGSRTVTGTGTTWSTNVDAGMLLREGTTANYGIVKSVDSNTQLTLIDPWPNAVSGESYTLYRYVAGETGALTVTTGRQYLAVAANRLIVGQDETIAFSLIETDPTPTFGDSTDYHRIPRGQVVGLQSYRDGVLVFTTAGVLLLGNIALDLTDASGNVQQTLTTINSDLVLWDDNGLANWRNAVVVPATDNIYLFDGSSTPVPMGEPVRDLYQSYVVAGYTLGLAQIHRGHYILPILNGTTWVDTLVCKLDSLSWSRLAGYSGQCIGFANRTATTGRRQTLLGINGTRLVDCSNWFDPAAAAKNDADGTTHAFTVTTRDYTLSMLKGFVKKIRVWVEGVDAGTDNPTLTVGYATGLPGGSFAALTGSVAESTGEAPSVLTANVAAQKVRFQITSTSPWATLKLKALDLFVRPRGRV